MNFIKSDNLVENKLGGIIVIISIVIGYLSTNCNTSLTTLQQPTKQLSTILKI